MQFYLCTNVSFVLKSENKVTLEAIWVPAVFMVPNAAINKWVSFVSTVSFTESYYSFLIVQMIRELVFYLSRGSMADFKILTTLLNDRTQRNIYNFLW